MNILTTWLKRITHHPTSLAIRHPVRYKAREAARTEINKVIGEADKLCDLVDVDAKNGQIYKQNMAAFEDTMSIFLDDTPEKQVKHREAQEQAQNSEGITN